MLRSTLFLALLMGATAVHAETNACTTINSLPVNITTPGAYCLQSNLAINNSQPAGTWSIDISASVMSARMRSGVHAFASTIAARPQLVACTS